MNEQTLAALMSHIAAFAKDRGLSSSETVGLLLIAGMLQQRAYSQLAGTPMDRRVAVL